MLENYSHVHFEIKTRQRASMRNGKLKQRKSFSWLVSSKLMRIQKKSVRTLEMGMICMITICVFVCMRLQKSGTSKKTYILHCMIVEDLVFVLFSSLYTKYIFTRLCHSFSFYYFLHSVCNVPVS